MVLPEAFPAIRIAIEGNLSAGKSTLCKILQRDSDFHVVREPVCSWQDVKPDEDDFDETEAEMASQAKMFEGKDGDDDMESTNLLDKFYADAPRWGFTFQANAFLSRLKTQLEAVSRVHPSFARPSASSASASALTVPDVHHSLPSGPSPSPAAAKSTAASPRTTSGGLPEATADSPMQTVAGKREPASACKDADVNKVDASKPFVFERSVLSDRFCFASNCRLSGLFSKVEWNVYRQWWTWMMKSFGGLHLDGIVYLRCSPSTCERRLKKRHRTEESTVSIDYLTQIHSRHESWLMQGNIAPAFRRPVLVIDCNPEFEHDEVRQRAMVAKIK